MNVRKALRPIYILFSIVNIIALVLYKQLKSKGIDTDVLLWGNIFVFALTIVSFYMLNKGLNAKTTFNFMSAVYGSFMMKLVVGAAAVVIYVLYAGEQKNLPAVFVSMFLYLFYTFFEIKGLLELMKKN
jgi:cobalamin biosynthesis protein CobD/CbiB